MRCIPQVQKEGTPHNAAVGKCAGMYRAHQNKHGGKRKRIQVW
jgi:hypothetical protein